MEATIDIRKEYTKKAKIPVINTGGIENQEEEKPLNAKSRILNPGTTRVTK